MRRIAWLRIAWLLFWRHSWWPLVTRRRYERDRAEPHEACDERHKIDESLRHRQVGILEARIEILEKEIGPRLDAMARVSVDMRRTYPFMFRVQADIDVSFVVRGSSDSALRYFTERIGRIAYEELLKSRPPMTGDHLYTKYVTEIGPRLDAMARVYVTEIGPRLDAPKDAVTCAGCQKIVARLGQ